MKTQLVPVDSIRVKWELNRDRNDEHVRALAFRINRDGFDENYPVSLVKVNGDLILAAGHHRFAAAIGEHVRRGDGGYERDLTFENLPLQEIWAEIVLGDIDDVVREMQVDHFQFDPAVTAGMGKPLTPNEKKEQCKTLLGFPEFYGKSLRALETEFGIPKSTLQIWKEEVTVQIGQCAAAKLTPEQLLSDFGMTPERLEKMRYLVDSGERSGADGRVMKTQASAEKKARAAEKAQARANAEFQVGIDGVQKGIDTILESNPTLKMETVRRRLFTDFGIGDPPELKDVQALTGLKNDLQKPSESSWCREFDLQNQVNEFGETLQELGPNFLIEKSARALQGIENTRSGDYESTEQGERLEKLEKFVAQLPGIIETETAARNAEIAKAEQARGEEQLRKAKSSALSAVEELKKVFADSAVVDKSAGGFRDFVAAACASGFCGQNVQVVDFITPNIIDEKKHAYRVRNNADKIVRAIAKAQKPTWMRAFFESAEEPNVAAAAGQARAGSVQKSGNEKHDEPSADRASVRSEMSDLKTDSAVTDMRVLETDLQAVVDCARAVVPARGNCALVGKYDELLSAEAISSEERVAILCDLLLLEKSRLQTARLTSRK